MRRLWFIMLLLCILAAPLAAQNMLPSLPGVRLGLPLNRGLTDWWMVMAPLAGGTAPLRNLVRPIDAPPTGFTLPATTTSGYQKATNRPGGQGEIALDGTDDYLCTTQVPSQGFSQFSVSAWFATTTTLDDKNLLGKGGSGQYAYMLTTVGANTIMFKSYDCAGANTRFQLQMVTATNDGAWHHVVMVYNDNVRGDIYRDGVLSATSTSFVAATFCTTSTQPFCIGCRAPAEAPFPGKVDDVRIWNRALNAAEVHAIYEDARTGYLRTLVSPASSLFLAAPAVTRTPKGRIY